MRNTIFLAVVVTMLQAVPAYAGMIRSPTAVISNTAGNFSAAAAIDSVIDQSGLTAGFTSGVSDFDTYLAGNPTHSWIFTDGAEWFSPQGVTSGNLVFDMGAAYDISRIALWNEEFSGIQTMEVQTSNDVLFLSFDSVGSFNPTNTPFDANYPAEVLNLTSTTNARYVRLQITGPQSPNRGTFLSMGEIAFDTMAAAVPEPSTLLLMGLGLGGLGFARRRRAND